MKVGTGATLFCTLATLAALAALPAVAKAACVRESNKSETSLPGAEGSEVALANMIIYSQEHMRYFFADNDSKVQPLPASGMALFTGYGLSPRTRLLNALTLPLREEEVTRHGGDKFSYYYPKLFMTGFEFDFLDVEIFNSKSCLRLSGSVGLALVLSPRILTYLPPFLLSRAAVGIAHNVDLNFGIGYSGNVISGAWFFPFGVSYRIERQ